MTDPEPRRPVRSFVRREGRMTRAQRLALDTLWGDYGVPAGDGVLDLDSVFGRRAPHVLEIGFGNGEWLAATAAAHPELDYLGIEVHRPGIGSLLQRAHALGLHNLRVICADAVETLNHRIADASLAAVYLLFPDPWPKKRHHKRRLVQPDFAALIARKLEAGGQFFLATDWEDYARQMLAVMDSAPGFVNCAGAGQYGHRPSDRAPTKFERRGARLGHGVWDLAYRRTTAPVPGG